MIKPIAEIKLNIKNPFEWASGYRMPIYNDNRLFLYRSEHRRLITNALIRAAEIMGVKKIDVIAGTSTAGIPWATSLANELGKSLVYIREKPKIHGLKNQIEGIDVHKSLAGASVIVVEDLISTGRSSAKAVQAVRDAGGECRAIVSIFNYGFKEAEEMFAGFRTFDDKNPELPKLYPPCEVFSLLEYNELMSVVEEEKYISKEELSLLKEWRHDLWYWGEKRGFPRIMKK